MAGTPRTVPKRSHSPGFVQPQHFRMSVSTALGDTTALPVPGQEQFRARTSQNVRLGSLRLQIASNENSFAELQYFPASVHLPPEAPTHYRVNCCNLAIDGPWPLQEIRSARDRNYRGGRFAAGYYLTDHFGPPAYLMTRGSDLWIFATHFEQIVWPFVVKFLLTAHSIERQMLHLKAAAIACGGSATLLVGRGGSGKTVLLTQLCANAGARFLANTHVCVREQTLLPVLSTMRVRKDRVFEKIIAMGTLPAAIKEGEFLADPCADLGWAPGPSTIQLRNILLLDYQGPEHTIIRAVDRDLLFDYMENFSLAVNIYGLREDVLDGFRGDVARFSIEWSNMKNRLRSLISGCKCYYISCDATQQDNLDTIRALITA